VASSARDDAKAAPCGDLSRIENEPRRSGPE
jgi:hypothetical protein